VISRKNILTLVCAIFIAGALSYLFLIKQEPDETELIEVAKEPLRRQEVVAKVAIVIDDLGYNLRNVEKIYGIEQPITLSILPNLPYTRKISLDGAQKGCEVMLHLPLESSQPEAPMEPDTIYTDMKKPDVIGKLDAALEDAIGPKGVSNHMGSKATKDRPLMRIIFEELNRRGLYFLDSLVTEKSVCEGVALETGIRFAKRDIYLDNHNERAYIKGQFKLLIEKAKKKKTAIGIGHDKPVTIEILAEEIPRAEGEGIKFVFVSELVK